jgi:hypothetical protein
VQPRCRLRCTHRPGAGIGLGACRGAVAGLFYSAGTPRTPGRHIQVQADAGAAAGRNTVAGKGAGAGPCAGRGAGAAAGAFWPAAREDKGRLKKYGL